MTYIYDAKFSGNILIVGRTGCGKTALVQKLAIDKFFGELDIAEWISYIKLDKKREAEIQSCFYCALNFYYPRKRNNLKSCLNILKLKQILQTLKMI